MDYFQITQRSLVVFAQPNLKVLHISQRIFVNLKGDAFRNNGITQVLRGVNRLAQHLLSVIYV